MLIRYASMVIEDEPESKNTMSTLPNNYADPVYGVATICHQVRCLRWGGILVSFRQPCLF